MSAVEERAHGAPLGRLGIVWCASHSGQRRRRKPTRREAMRASLCKDHARSLHVGLAEAAKKHERSAAFAAHDREVGCHPVKSPPRLQLPVRWQHQCWWRITAPKGPSSVVRHERANPLLSLGAVHEREAQSFLTTEGSEVSPLADRCGVRLAQESDVHRADVVALKQRRHAGAKWRACAATDHFVGRQCCSRSGSDCRWGGMCHQTDGSLRQCRAGAVDRS